MNPINVSTSLTFRNNIRFDLPTVASVPQRTDLVTLSASPAGQDKEARRKMFRQVEWAGFGAEMIGGTLTLAGHGAIGLPLAAAGAALMLYGGYKRQRV